VAIDLYSQEGFHQGLDQKQDRWRKNIEQHDEINLGRERGAGKFLSVVVASLVAGIRQCLDCHSGSLGRVLGDHGWQNVGKTLLKEKETI
jgi:hypothetical protein